LKKLFGLLVIAVFVLSMTAVLSVGAAPEMDARGRPSSPPGQDKPDDPEPDPTPGDIFTAPGNKYAVVIGISDYETDANDLNWCDEDSQEWKAYLQGEGFTVKYLQDSQATYQAIWNAMDWLSSIAGPDDACVITYSGHGYYSQSYRESCFITHDEYGFWETTQGFGDFSWNSNYVWFFDDACNQGTMENLAQNGWVMAIGSNKRTYTYDSPSHENGIFSYWAFDGIANGLFTAEEISQHAINGFNAETPGRAFLVDQFTGLFDP
jgi:hypothetical protein